MRRMAAKKALVKHSIKIRVLQTLVTLSSGMLLTLVSGCNARSDEDLKRNFENNQSNFAQLAAMSLADINLSSLGTKQDSQNAITQERWSKYQRSFQELGIKEGMAKRRSFPETVFFYVECTGSAVTRDCKGYAYSKNVLKPIAESLNRPTDGISFKHLSSTWYLFRDSN